MLFGMLLIVFSGISEVDALRHNTLNLFNGIKFKNNTGLFFSSDNRHYLHVYKNKPAKGERVLVYLILLYRCFTKHFRLGSSG